MPVHLAKVGRYLASVMMYGVMVFYRLLQVQALPSYTPLILVAVPSIAMVDFIAGEKTTLEPYQMEASIKKFLLAGNTVAHLLLLEVSIVGGVLVESQPTQTTLI